MRGCWSDLPPWDASHEHAPGSTVVNGSSKRSTESCPLRTGGGWRCDAPRNKEVQTPTVTGLCMGAFALPHAAARACPNVRVRSAL